MVSSLLNIFAASPFKPMEEHMRVAFAAVEQLPSFTEAVLRKQWDEAATIGQRIAAQEDKADNIKKEIRLHLPNHLFLPVSRSDLLELLTIQDELANTAKDIVGVVLGRKIYFPEVSHVSYSALIKAVVAAAGQACKAIGELEGLLESSFRGHEVALVEKMVQQIDTLEAEADKIQRMVQAQIFAIETTLPPIEAIFLYKVIDMSGDLGNCAQRVGHRLQYLLAR